MPRGRKPKAAKYKTAPSRVMSDTRSHKVSFSNSSESLLQTLWSQLNLNQSYLSLVLGLLIVLVVGILAFNYFKMGQASTIAEVGTSQQTENKQVSEKIPDVSPTSLPGKYTVKDGDTLFTIAEKYYGDGYKYAVLVEANKISDENFISAGQTIEVPKVEQVALNTQESPATVTEASTQDSGKGGATNVTIWGEKITSDTYTVKEGDWLSTIAGRAYGDVMAFNKIAQANNLSNPDLIETGQVLKIPR